MKEPYRPWHIPIIVATCAVILLVVLIDYPPTRNWLCPAVESRSRCARALLAEFQTLITGVAALIAAIITVATMQQTAAADRKRHRQALYLALRPDYLKIERLIEPQLHQLESCVAYLERFQAAFDPYSYTAINVLWQIEASAARALEVIERDCWREAAPLFSGQMTKMLADYKSDLIDLISTSKDFREKLRKNESWAKAPKIDGIPQISAQASTVLVGARTILGFAARDGFQLMLHMKTLAEEYLEGELRELSSIKIAVKDDSR